MAMPITTPVFRVEEPDPNDHGLRAYTAWFKAEGHQRLSRNPRRQHLLHVSQVLLEGARDGAYDGLIIIAAEPVVAELKEALAPETRALLIGRIVRNFVGFEAPTPYEPSEMRH